MSDWDDELVYNDSPTVEQLAEGVASGLYCAECSCQFTEPHNQKVCCAFCFARLTDAEVKTMGVRLATHAELNREGWRAINTKRKTT
jgi:hypothetical protein